MKTEETYQYTYTDTFGGEANLLLGNFAPIPQKTPKKAVYLASATLVPLSLYEGLLRRKSNLMPI